MTAYDRHHTIYTPEARRPEPFDWNRPVLSAARRWRASLEPLDTPADRERHARTWDRVGTMRQALLTGAEEVDAVLAVRVSGTNDGRDWIESMASYGRRFGQSPPPPVVASSAPRAVASAPALRTPPPRAWALGRPRLPGERGYYPPGWAAANARNAAR
jgi:hypothetical protein